MFPPNVKLLRLSLTTCRSFFESPYDLLPSARPSTLQKQSALLLAGVPAHAAQHRSNVRSLVMAIQRRTVSSTMISAIGYDDSTSTLEVTFNNGRTYSYQDVPVDEYVALGDASSVGRYFLDNIRDQYRSR